MSKYLKTGPSRYSKSRSLDSQKTTAAVTSAAESDVKPMAKPGASGYTERDEQLFDELASSTPITRSQPAAVTRQATYQTPYSEHDAELFQQLHPGTATRRLDAGGD